MVKLLQKTGTKGAWQEAYIHIRQQQKREENTQQRVHRGQSPESELYMKLGALS
jgi:hypothetical protein